MAGWSNAPVWPWLLDENGQAELTSSAPWGYVLELAGEAGDIYTITAETLYHEANETPIIVIKNMDGIAIGGTNLSMGTGYDEVVNTQLMDFELPAEGIYTIWV